MDNIELYKLRFDDCEEVTSDLIGSKKEFSKIVSKARALAKGDKCFYCGKNVSSFCNSHSVPAFCLRNISVNGKVFFSNKFMDFPLSNFDKGVNEAGTFNIICRDCDSQIFQQYEDPFNYDTKPTPQMLAQIAMKNHLKSISKRLYEYAIFEIVKEHPLTDDGFIEHNHTIQNADLKEFKENFLKAKRLSKKNWDGEYNLFFYEKLDYVVPIAFQGTISLITDLDGNIVNDIYYSDIKYRIEDFHVCIFPLQERSIVMIFVDKNYKRYRKFYKKFKNLSLEEKLSTINYIIFLYSEDMFLSKELSEDVFNNENLLNIARQTSIALSDTLFFNALEKAKEIYDLSKHNTIPNLLSEEYKVR